MNGTPDGVALAEVEKEAVKRKVLQLFMQPLNGLLRQLKKHRQSRLPGKSRSEAQAKAKATGCADQRLKDIVNEALRHNASRTPSATDLLMLIMQPCRRKQSV